MGSIGFVIANPQHHAELMLPVIREVAARGHATTIISLAELRGFTTPSWDTPAKIERAVPANVRKDPSLGAESTLIGPGRAGRSMVQRAAWLALGPRLRWLLRNCDCVVVPNDAAFPYADLVDGLRARKVPVVLMQEGIRFPLPNERGGARYGAGGATRICAWGEGSAEHFATVAKDPRSIVVTGNPRLETIDPPAWAERGTAARKALGIGGPPLLYLSNPIDDQGFCTTAEKLALFAAFLDGAADELVRRATPVVVKLHPREDATAFRALAQHAPVPTVVATEVPLFALLASARAAVVLASTVGLEALMFGLPLGVLEVPNAGHVFEYVARGAAVGLRTDTLGADVAALFDGAAARRPAAQAFVARHLGGAGQPGHAARAIAQAVIDARGARG